MSNETRGVAFLGLSRLKTRLGWTITTRRWLSTGEIRVNVETPDRAFEIWLSKDEAVQLAGQLSAQAEGV